MSKITKYICPIYLKWIVLKETPKPFLGSQLGFCFIDRDSEQFVINVFGKRTEILLVSNFI